MGDGDLKEIEMKVKKRSPAEEERRERKSKKTTKIETSMPE